MHRNACKKLHFLFWLLRHNIGVHISTFHFIFLGSFYNLFCGVVALGLNIEYISKGS